MGCNNDRYIYGQLNNLIKPVTYKGAPIDENSTVQVIVDNDNRIIEAKIIEPKVLDLTKYEVGEVSGAQLTIDNDNRTISLTVDGGSYQGQTTDTIQTNIDGDNISSSLIVNALLSAVSVNKTVNHIRLPIYLSKIYTCELIESLFDSSPDGVHDSLYNALIDENGSPWLVFGWNTSEHYIKIKNVVADQSGDEYSVLFSDTFSYYPNGWYTPYIGIDGDVEISPVLVETISSDSTKENLWNGVTLFFGDYATARNYLCTIFDGKVYQTRTKLDGIVTTGIQNFTAEEKAQVQENLGITEAINDAIYNAVYTVLNTPV